MKFIKLNEAELSNVIGGKLTDVKNGFVETITDPFKTIWNTITFQSGGDSKTPDTVRGNCLGYVTLAAAVYFSPWLYKKVVQLKSLILS